MLTYAFSATEGLSGFHAMQDSVLTVGCSSRNTTSSWGSLLLVPAATPPEAGATAWTTARSISDVLEHLGTEADFATGSRKPSPITWITLLGHSDEKHWLEFSQGDD
jgi:hypothetical protein